MTQKYPAAGSYVGVTEAPPSLAECADDMTTTGRQSSAVQSYTSVTEAALALGHRSYSGTVASTVRVP